MRRLKDKQCSLCGKIYTPTGSCSKYCDACKEEQRKAYMREAQYKYRAKQGKPTFVGKGGSNKKFTSSPFFKNGIGNFIRLRKQIKEEVRYCEECGKDLLSATRYEWCVHHIDHNRSNNIRENMKLLCKRCHQLTHNCTNNLPQYLFESATTILKRSRAKAQPEACSP